MTTTIEAVTGDSTKVKVTVVTTINNRTTTEVDVFDKDTYIANQYQRKAQATANKASTATNTDAIIADADSNIAAAEAL